MAEDANMLHVSRGDDEEEEEEDLGECIACGKNAVGVCELCGEAAYCSAECHLADWDEHCDECEVVYQADPGSTAWVTEHEVGQEEGGRNAKEEYQPVAMIHAFLGKNGLLVVQADNEELSDKIQGGIPSELGTEGFGFFGRRSVTRSGRQAAPAGARPRRGDQAQFRVLVKDLIKDNVSPFIDAEINVPMPQRSHWKPGKQGINAYATGRDIDGSHGVFGTLPTIGRMAIGLEYNGLKHQIWGRFDLKTGGVGDRPRSRGRRFFGGFRSFFRRRFRLPKKIRLMAADSDGRMVAIGLERPETGGMTNVPGSATVKYSIRYLEMFIPQSAFQDGYRGTWADPFDNQPDLGPGGDDEPDTSKKEATGIASLKAMREDPTLWPDAMIVETPDPDTLEDMIALASLVSQEIDDLRMEQEWARDANDQKDIKIISGQIEEASRIRAVLDQHIKDLEADENGTADYNEIPSNVNAAITDATELIAARGGNPFAGLKKRFGKKGRLERALAQEDKLYNQIRELFGRGQRARRQIRLYNRVQKRITRLGGVPAHPPVSQLRGARRVVARERRARGREFRKELRKGFKERRRGEEDLPSLPEAEGGGEVEAYGRGRRAYYY